jgi:MinD superfamily P-loop ATPase
MLFVSGGKGETGKGVIAIVHAVSGLDRVRIIVIFKSLNIFTMSNL